MRIKSLLSSFSEQDVVKCQKCLQYYSVNDMPVHLQFCTAQQPSLVIEPPHSFYQEEDDFVVVTKTPERQRTKQLNVFNDEFQQQQGDNNVISDEEFARKLYEEEMASIKRQREMEEQLTLNLLQQEKGGSFNFTSPSKQFNNSSSCDACKSHVELSSAVFGEVCYCTAVAKIYFIEV